MEADGTLITLNEQTHPDSWLHRSHPDDVARVEHLTFVCTQRAATTPARTTTGCRRPTATRKMDALFAGCMRGRTMYVIPYCMGPIDSPLSRCGVEITDSPYVVANMRIMTRMGAPALARIEREGTFVRGLHSIGELDPERRFIMHFPEELTIKSYGSGYGGNALLGKKCHALRIASHQARSEGWLAEHMLIVGIENPQGETHYVAAAFPSACGKTNLAMLIPPEGYRDAGLEGVDRRRRHLLDAPRRRRPPVRDQPGSRLLRRRAGHLATSPTRTRWRSIQHDTIFTNVGVTADNQPWWEGLDNGAAPRHRLARQRRTTPANGPAAHPNSRFTVSREAVPELLAAGRGPAGRADLARSCSAAAAPRWCRWCSKRATGRTACWSAPRWARKPPPPRPARSA